MQRRRQFLAAGLGASGAAIFIGATPQAEAKLATGAKCDPGPALRSGQPDKLSLTEADKAILNCIDGFTNRMYIVGGSVAGKTASSTYRYTQLIASIKDLEEFQERLTEKGSPMGNGMAIGNKICFNHLDTTFEVEFLVDETFQKRVQEIQTGLRANGEPIVFAHEALLYDPEQKKLTDPYKAIHGRTAALKRMRYTESYEELFQASQETICFNLTPSARDQAALNILLARKVTSKVQAEAIAKAFLQSLSLASQVSQQASMAKLFSSNLVRSALQTEFGFDSLRVSQNFARIRPRQPATVTDGIVWHAICKGAEKATNGVYRVSSFALGGSSQLKTFLTMQEYQSVSLLMADKAFRIYA